MVMIISSVFGHYKTPNLNEYRQTLRWCMEPSVL